MPAEPGVQSVTPGLTTHGESGAEDDGASLSLVSGDAAYRLQRRIGLIPAKGLGIGRRLVILPLVAWLPMAIWAVLNHRALAGAVQEPLLSHYGIHVRCLVAIPLLLVAEALAQGVMPKLIPYFVTSGLVPADCRDRFRQILSNILVLRDRWLPWIVILGVAFALSTIDSFRQDIHEVAWAASDAPAGLRLGFGGWWYLLVVRPLYVCLILTWVWRLVLLAILFWRVSGLPLSLVPTHPDRAGGLAFVERFAVVFSPVLLAHSAVLSASWAHSVIYHGVEITALRAEMVAAAILLVVVFALPYLSFVRALGHAKRQAELEYGVLAGRHGRLVREKWILGKQVGEPPVLDAPELGPVADMVGLYGAVAGMRGLPLGKRGLAMIVLPVVVPMLLVAAIQVPVKDLLMKVLGTLV